MWGCFRSFEYEKLRNCCFLYQLLFPHCEQWKYPGWLYDVGDFTAQIILGLYEQCSKPDCLRHIEDYTTHVRIIINHYIKGSLLNNRYFMERSESFFDLIMGWMYGIYCIYIYIYLLVQNLRISMKGSPWTFTIPCYMFRQDTTYI